MPSIVLVFLGAGLGGVLRHGVNLAALRFAGGFPYATLTVNILGSFLMGVLTGFLALRAGGGGQAARLFLATGVLGGFTTFSAFSLDTMLLWERGDLLAAALYVLLSVALSLAALAAGIALMRALV